MVNKWSVRRRKIAGDKRFINAFIMGEKEGINNWPGLWYHRQGENKFFSESRVLCKLLVYPVASWRWCGWNRARSFTKFVKGEEEKNVLTGVCRHMVWRGSMKTRNNSRDKKFVYLRLRHTVESFQSSCQDYCRWSVSTRLRHSFSSMLFNLQLLWHFFRSFRHRLSMVCM